MIYSFVFFNDTATSEIYTYLHTLSLHDSLTIYQPGHFGADRHLPRADACRLPREAHRDADDARPCGSQAAGCRHPREERALTWRSATYLPSKTEKSEIGRASCRERECQYV